MNVQNWFAGATAPDVAVYIVAAAMTLIGAIVVVSVRNPVRAALGLVVTLFGVAVLFVELKATFLAAVQVIVYAGAIVVLFLFVIMLLGVDRPEPISRNRFRFGQPIAVLVGMAIVALSLVIGEKGWRHTGKPSQGGALSGDGLNVEKLADSLFTQYLFLFEATSLLLVIAVVGAVVFARRSARVEEHRDGGIEYAETQSDEDKKS